MVVDQLLDLLKLQEAAVVAGPCKHQFLERVQLRVKLIVLREVFMLGALPQLIGRAQVKHAALACLDASQVV